MTNGLFCFLQAALAAAGSPRQPFSAIPAPCRHLERSDGSLFPCLRLFSLPTSPSTSPTNNPSTTPSVRSSPLQNPLAANPADRAPRAFRHVAPPACPELRRVRAASCRLCSSCAAPAPVRHPERSSGPFLPFAERTPAAERGTCFSPCAFRSAGVSPALLPGVIPSGAAGFFLPFAERTPAAESRDLSSILSPASSGE